MWHFFFFAQLSHFRDVLNNMSKIMKKKVVKTTLLWMVLIIWIVLHIELPETERLWINENNRMIHRTRLNDPHNWTKWFIHTTKWLTKKIGLNNLFTKSKHDWQKCLNDSQNPTKSLIPSQIGLNGSQNRSEWFFHQTNRLNHWIGLNDLV